MCNTNRRIHLQLLACSLPYMEEHGTSVVSEDTVFWPLLLCGALRETLPLKNHDQCTPRLVLCVHMASPLACCTVWRQLGEATEADRGEGQGVSCLGPRKTGGPTCNFHYVVCIGWEALLDYFVLGSAKAVSGPGWSTDLLAICSLS